MTMSSSVSKVTLNGDGVQTEFPFSFKVWEEADLQVLVTDADGATVEATSWTAVVDETGGTVTYPETGDPLPSGHKITIARAMDFLQDVDLVSGTRWDPEVVETALDRKTAELQQLKERLDRAVVVDIASGDDPKDLVDSIFASEAAASAAASAAADSAVAAHVAASSVWSASESGVLTAGQDTITLANAYDHVDGAAAVYLGGVKQSKSTLTFVDSTHIQLGGAVTEDTTWEVVSMSMAGESAMTAIRDAAIAAKNDALVAQAAAELAETNAELAETNAEAAQAAAEAARDAALAAGRVLQKVVAISTATFDITARIPDDTSIPQNTEGVEIISNAFTPKSATSKILVTVSFWGVATNGVCTALFNGGANAFAAARTHTNVPTAGNLSGVFNSPGTSGITISARAGRPDTTGNAYVNRAPGGAAFGASSVITLTIEEIAA